MLKLKKNIISVGTVTYALKGRDILRNNGYKAFVERNSRNIGKYGCGYQIVSVGDTNAIVDILNEAGIKILNIA